jgi:hypothetical protein
MKKTQLVLLCACLALMTSLMAQDKGPQLLLKTGSIPIVYNLKQSLVDSFNLNAGRFHGQSFAVLHFENIPSAEQRKVLSSSGIQILDYIPNNSYTISIKGQVKLQSLLEAGARALFTLRPEQKMDGYLASGKIPSWAVKAGGTVDCWISFPKSFEPVDVLVELQKRNIDVVSSQYADYQIIHIRIATTRITEIAGLPFVDYIQPAPPEDHTTNYNSRAASRGNVLNASVADGGKGLNGEGVVVGIGDNADVQTHADFAGRLINRSAAPLSAGHGHHVHGSAVGAGNINELYRGYAPKSLIISQAFSGIINNAPAYVQDYGMVITNNSYGNINECAFHGSYDLYSRLLDQQAFDLPHLQHVFSAGNSGTMNCAPYPVGFRTVYGGYQSAKNVLTVGSTTDSGAISGFSSKGPVRDGRTKPEIVSMGSFVASAWAGNIYGYNNGTSMAAPQVSGGLALLYQRYRQLNGGANPKSALMKAIICNGSADRGNVGPDYSYGFGWMNLLRSTDMIEQNHYFTSGSNQGTTITHNITVPANTAQLKVMLYWHDPAASLVSTQTLVNDLDLEVVDPSATLVLPRVLDTTAANITNPSTSGADHINNMEQVTIVNPASGTYTFRVKGTAITQNAPQEYFVVYDVIPVELKLTSPIGGEGWAPSTNDFDRMKISWEAAGFASGTATLEYSVNNGATWINIASGINVNRLTYTWWIPNVSSNQVRVRITKDGSGETSMSNPFTITGQPVVSLAAIQCQGYIALNWTAVADPSAVYEVMMLRGDEMKQVAVVPYSQNTYTFSGLSPDSLYWVTVRAVLGGKAGRRAQAVSRQPNSGSCSGSISDNDLQLIDILTPVSGRAATSTSLGANSVVSAQLKNLDDVAISNFDIKYSINGGPWVTENIASSIAAGATFNYNFVSTANLSAIGSYQVAVVVHYPADPVRANDTLYQLVKQLPNPVINLATPFLDQLETASTQTYLKDTTGLNGLDRYDFENSTAFGRLRTFVNSGMAFSGTKALTLDADRIHNPGNTNYLYGTFNLSLYNAVTNDLRLDFQFAHHNQPEHPSNKVWIRGSDTQPWIEAFDLDAHHAEPGQYSKSASIEISDLLTANGQSLTSSFQVRWGQFGQYPATDREVAGGYSFDDIRLYEVFNDLQMLRIDTPVTVSCGLNASVPVGVSVRNSSNTMITNVPVRYRVNNGTWINEVIPSIAANDTVQYGFIAAANLSALGTYIIEAVVDYGADSFRENDTTRTTIVNTPVITTFPYLQNFETGDGYWYPQGKNSSWAYGTPVSSRINRAASGAKAWKTRLEGNYNDNELSYLYSPCFNVVGMTAPTLSFSVALDLEDCGADLCDAAWIEYSADGITWTKLGAQGTGTNWYNKADQVWSIQNYTRWHVATTALPAGIEKLRIRFVFNSDPAVNREGMAIDDIHVYDNTKGIYTGTTMAGPVSQAVSGNSWIHFESGGQLVASVHPNNQDLGMTSVQAYIHTAAVRFTSTQYYHNRNITIKPVNTALADSAMVRFYFLDTETEALIAATSCAGCTKPASAYELGVSKYSDTDDGFENGTISDNNQGMWSFINSDVAVKVPFDRGYYAEFRVKDFSEFWLNNGGFNRSTPLPVKLLDFIVQKQGVRDVLVKWTVAAEENVEKYEVELARSSADLASNRFTKIGEVASLGNTSSLRDYSFTDVDPLKSGIRYYRLKMVDLDGSFKYSPIRSVQFSDEVVWQVYPNPSYGSFWLVYQVNNQERLLARVYDSKGSVVKEISVNGNGTLQKIQLDLSAFANGVYLLKVFTGDQERSFKLNKH